MDREKAKDLINAGKETNSTIKLGNKEVTFSRAETEDIQAIEEYTDEELIEGWKAIDTLISDYGFSIRDLQIRSLLELEIGDRGLEGQL